MLSVDQADKIASSFLVHYYDEFTTGSRTMAMIDLYSENSYVVTVDLGQEVPVVAHGKSEIAMYLARLEHTLSQRKVEIITADHVPLLDNGIQIICQGIMYLRRARRVFLHAFVLAPTPYRPGTFFIVSDYLRFVNAEEEVIPADAAILTPDQVALYLAEEARRQEEQRQRQQLLEFQQKLRAQNAKPPAAPAAAVEEPVREKMAIPTPASKQRQMQAAAEKPPAPVEKPPVTAAEKPEAAAPKPSTPAVEAPVERGRGWGGRGRGSYADAASEGAMQSRGRGAARGGRGEGEERGRGRERERGRGGRGAARGGRGGEVAANGVAEARGRGGRGGRGGAERKPQEEAAPQKPAAAAKEEGEKKQPRERKTGPTPFVRLSNVPKVVKLSVLKEDVGKAAEAPKDAYWFGHGSPHAVVEFSSVTVAESVVKKGKVKIGEFDVKVFAFYP